MNTQDFIINVELSAKKILREANRKQRDAARHDEYEAFKAQKVAEKLAKSKKSNTTVVIPAITERLDKKLSMTASADILESPSQTLKKTRVMQYSIPRMVVSMGTASLDEEIPHDYGGHSHMKSLVSPRGGQLSPIKTRENKRAVAKEQALKRSAVYEKLNSSPFLTQSQPNLKTLFEKEVVKEVVATNVDLEAPSKQTDWALKIHASAVFAGKTKSKRTFGHAKQPSDVQGPVDWSSEGLRAKYRGEEQREQAWQAFLDAQAFITLSAEEGGPILPVISMERHPVYVFFQRRIDHENLNSKMRTKARLRMKRFVMDVQEVWLSNLQHLSEHQPREQFFASRPNTREFIAASQSKGRVKNPISAAEAIPPIREEGWGEGQEPQEYDQHRHSTGLSRGRDVDAITNMSYQIQSVSSERAMEANFATVSSAEFSEPHVELDWIPAVPPTLPEPPAEPYLLESLVAGRVMYTTSKRPFVVLVDRLKPPTSKSASSSSSSSTDQSASNNNNSVASGSSQQSNHLHQQAPKKRKAIEKSKSLLPAEPEGIPVWRVSIIRMEDGRVRYHYASESFVDAFMAGAMADKGLLSPQINTVKSEIAIKALQVTHELAWGRSEITAKVVIKLIRPQSFDPSNSFEISRDSARVVVTAILQGGFDDQPPLTIVISAVEFLSLVNLSVDPPSGPFSVLISSEIGLTTVVKPWWLLDTEADGTCEVTTSHFELLLSQIAIAVGDVNDDGDAVPVTLILKTDTVASQTRGAAINLARAENHKKPPLHVTKASSIAHQLVNCLAINFDDLSASFSYSKRGSSAIVNLNLLSWKDAVVTACGGARIDELCRRPRFQSTLMKIHDGTIDPPDGNIYSSGLNDIVITKELPYSNFEDFSDDITSLSLRVSGGTSRMNQVPGTTQCGVKDGLWFSYPLHPERTQVAASMFRDKHLSSTDSVLVNVTHALDTSILCPILLSWEPNSEVPQRTVFETVAGAYVSMKTQTPKLLLAEKLDSPLEYRNSEVVMAFNTVSEEGTDYMMPTGLHAPKGMFRRFADIDNHGFRRKKLQTLMSVEAELPTVVFGITKLGALPNSTGVHTRNIWHASIAVTEHINRSRGPKDYHYVIHNETHQGPNNPAAFAIKLSYMTMMDLQSSSFAQFEKKYDFIADARARFARKLALETKIENSEIVLKTRDKEFASSIRDTKQRLIDKKMRKANKSEIGWRQRYYHSSLVEVVDNWERRKDDRTGMCFFHQVTKVAPSKERFMDTCQWEVPMTWDRDLLVDVHSENNVSIASFSASNNADEGAFEEPNETWYPEPGDVRKIETKTLATPGIAPSGLKKLSDFEPQIRKTSMISGVSAHASSNSSGVPPAGDDRSGVDAFDPNQDADALAKALLQSDQLMVALCRRLGLPITNVVPNKDIIPGSLPGSIADDGDASISTLGSGSVGFKEKNVIKGLITDQNNTKVPSLKFSVSGKVNTGGGDAREIDISNAGNIRGGIGDVDIMDPEADSDDDDLWSDDDQQVGNLEFEGDDEIGDLPQNHKDVATLRIAKKKAEKMTGDGTELKQRKDVPDSVPFMNLEDNGLSSSAEDANAEKAKTWRRLPRPNLPSNFFEKCTQVRTLGPYKDAADTFNKPVFLLPISPVDACNYIPENFSVAVESIFIHDARKDMERVIATIDRNIQKEEIMSVELPTNDLLLFGEAKDMTSVDNFVAEQYKQDKGVSKDVKQVAIDKAILAAKSSSLAEMEDALEEDIPIDSIDQFGNSLLILAAQQGSKRMCKFLMRRGAKVNAQNLVGNTSLHYCYAYHHPELGEYLKRRGANDAILNGEGLTCYEGLSKDTLNEL